MELVDNFAAGGSEGDGIGLERPGVEVFDNCQTLSSTGISHFCNLNTGSRQAWVVGNVDRQWFAGMRPVFGWPDGGPVDEKMANV